MARNPYQRADHRTREARAQGYPARSVFKLEEIDHRVKLLRQGQHVLDLGAAPGSWTLYASQRVGSKGVILAVDLSEVDQSFAPNVTFVCADALVLDDETLGRFAPYDVVLSDMAPATSGNQQLDHLRSAELYLRALDVAEAMCAPGGSFVGKIFMGERFEEARNRTRTLYGQVRVIRPEGTRRRSVETFLVGLGRKVGA